MKKIVKKSTVVPEGLVDDIRLLINTTRQQVAQAINSSLVILYWNIGKRIKTEILKEKRAEYGEEILTTLSAELTPIYGDGFSPRNISRMVKFVELFSEEKIVTTLSSKLGWSHFVEILQVKDGLAREFYSEMCRIEQWSVRTLRQKIGGMLFERTAISKKPQDLIKKELAELKQHGKMTPDLVFRDPYILNFLNLKGNYSEKDLETAILRELEKFILELGKGFSFIARQKRIIVDGQDFYIDLLFYHRELRRLVVVELKLDKFKPEFKGQMELYLRWLDKYERKPQEEHPIGLILCFSKSQEQIELLELSKGGIRVAEYLTQLPPRDILERKLHDAIKIAQSNIENHD